MAAPAYAANEPATTSAHDRSESVSSVAAPNSDTVFGQAESSLTDTGSVEGTSAEIKKPAGPRYVYYRIYAEDGAIPSVNPVYSDDPYLGRIPARLVTPPHTALNLRRCLSDIENIGDKITTRLFISASSQNPMDDTGRVSIHAYPGPGHMPNEPVALVAMCAGSSLSKPKEEITQQEDPLVPREGAMPVEMRYIYYQVYKTRAVRSKQPANSNDPYVGRINVDCVPPPHTAASIMRCISKIEELDYSLQSQLFTDISSESPIGEGHVSILTSDCPGSTPDDPMAFVEMPAPAYPAFNKRMRVTVQWPQSSGNPNWLMDKVGEIVRISNDEPQSQSYVYNGASLQGLAYEAVNDAGQRGLVYKTHVTPC